MTDGIGDLLSSVGMRWATASEIHSPLVDKDKLENVYHREGDFQRGHFHVILLHPLAITVIVI